MSDLCRCADEVRCDMRAEIERLTAELFTMRNIFHEQDTRIAELEVARAYWYCENCGCHNCLDAEELSNEQ